MQPDVVQPSPLDRLLQACSVFETIWLTENRESDAFYTLGLQSLRAGIDGVRGEPN